MARTSRHEWLRHSAARPQDAARKRSAAQATGRRLRVESLEDRRLLANVTVSTLSDVVNGNVSSISALVASNGGDGISLREAILAANANVAADTIDFAASLTSGGPAVIQLTNVGHVGEIAISRDVTINGPGAALLAIKAFDPTPGTKNGDGSRVFNIDDGSFSTQRNVALSQLTLTGGDVSGNGGAILSDESVTITGCTISGNSAGSDGGGVYGGNGTIVRSHITGNTAAQFGGGLAFSGDVSDSTIKYNQAKYGGGLSGGRTITNTVIFNNTASNDGGGVFGNQGALVNCTVSSNIAGRDGGGVWGNNGPSGLDGCTLSLNTAGRSGGGMFVAAGPSGILNTTITGNLAQNGGGIFLSGFTQFDLRHSTVVDNRARYDLPPAFGHSIYCAGGVLKLDHSIVTNIFTFSGNTVEARYSIVSSNVDSPLVEAPIGAPDANGNLIGGPIHGDIDPGLAPLADNGGRVSTHAFLSRSHARDAGDPAATAGAGGVPAVDGRGAPFVRIAGSRIDIGAFEQQSLPGGTLTVDTLVDEDDANYGPGDLSLREAIHLAIGSVGADAITFASALTAGGPASIVLTRGALDIGTSLSIIGPGADLLTIDASGNDPTPMSTFEDGDANDSDGSGVFVVRGPGFPAADIDVTMSGLTITGADGGSGIRSSFCNLTVVQSRITGNLLTGSGASGYGGGMYFSAGTLKIYDSSITHNTADGGGGLFAGGIGGGYGTSLEIHNSVISDNVAGHGGGIWALNANPWTITGSTVSNNVAVVGSGILTWSDLTVRASTISGNVAPFNGANFQCGGGISSGSFYGNPTIFTTITVSDSTISGNRTPLGGGGGIFTGGTVNVTRSTIVGNAASAGGGIWAGQMSLNQTIVANNTQNDVQGNGTALFSLIGNKGSATIVNGGGSLIGTPGATINPLLGPLADNGGPTMPDGSKMLTHALLLGSPAIDAGNPAAAPGAGGVPLYDQRGAIYARVFGGRIDMGAIELQPNADFDGNHRIDGDDFLVWQRGLGTPSPNGTHAAGDADNDRDVDADDLAAWRAAFGSPASAATAGPGASAAVMALSSASSTSDRHAAPLTQLSPAIVDAAFAMEQSLARPRIRFSFRSRQPAPH